MKPRNPVRKTLLVSLLLLLVITPLIGLAKESPPMPDLTQGGKKDETHDWTLGPTGARGWVWGSKGQTTDARQILVTAVAKGSPADGILVAGDVILGVGAQRFADDARIRFAKAITEVEQGKGGGLLRLIRWREGQVANVDLKLPVLGSYSETAPYDCPKSKRIFEQGCRAIAASGFKDKRGEIQVSIPNDLNALALLASGQKEYQPLVAEYARKVADHTPGGHISWGYGYDTLFLAEYALATRDEAVMAGLRRLSTDIARGASAVGTWGHAFAVPAGNLGGYGCMNQPGIILTLALVVSREAGVKDPDLDRVIERSCRFLRWYVNKGAIPYGDHEPWPWHEDNGKCSSGAVLFDLLGDREAAVFFAKMGTAAYSEREWGHTGNFFNVLWAMPGVSRCGPLATGAYLKEQAWYYDLARNWDGGFRYQGSPAGAEEHGKYTNWDCTGAYLLAYGLPLKSLCLTGKKPCSVPPLTRQEVDEVIAAGRDFSPSREKSCYESRKTEQLMAGLASWSPAVRKRSAQTLSLREGDFVPALVKLLTGSNRDARCGAAEALGLLGPRADAAAPQLRALLNDPDPWLQCLACESLPMLGPEVRKAIVPDLLRMTVRENPADPRRMAQRSACAALFSPRPGKREPKSILSDSLDGVDRQLLYPAIKSVLENEDGCARGQLSGVYGKLNDQDVVALLPAIVKAIQKPAPSGEMFADGIRMAGLDLLSRLHIREGMPMCVELMEPARWGESWRVLRCFEYLTRYGTHAKEMLPQLQEVRQIIIKRNPKKEKSENAIAFDKALAKLEAATASPTLLGLEEFNRKPVGSR